jgi:hypothetical protein
MFIHQKSKITYNMVNVNIKRFSRGSFEEEAPTQTTEQVIEAPLVEAPPKRGRGRPKKVVEPESYEEPIQEVEQEPVYLPEPTLEEVDDSFLDDLRVPEDQQSDKSITPPQSPPKKKKGSKGKKTAFATDSYAIPDFNPVDFFSAKPTPILGKEKRELLVRLAQYRKLFPQELKDFKLPKNPTVEQLQQACDECEIITTIGSLDNFLTDCILQAIQVLEAVSQRSEKMDISGTADQLRENPLFHNLCKQLYLKYKVFASVPVEYQMLMLVGTTMVIQSRRNFAKKLYGSDFLNQPAN